MSLNGKEKDTILLQVEIKHKSNKAPFTMYGSVCAHDNTGKAYLFPLPWIYDFKLGQGNHQNARMTQDMFAKIMEYNDKCSFFHYVAHMLTELSHASGRPFSDLDAITFSRDQVTVPPSKRSKTKSALGSRRQKR